MNVQWHSFLIHCVIAAIILFLSNKIGKIEETVIISEYVLYVTVWSINTTCY